MIQEGIVEIFTTQVGVTGSGLDGENTAVDVEKRHIEGTSTEIEDEDILLSLGLSVKTVGNGSGSRLVDDTENIKASDGTSILGSQTLGIVEVGRNAENRRVNN